MMDAGSIKNNMNITGPGQHVGRASGKTPAKIGYSPVPSDEYKPEKEKEQGIIAKTVDKMAGFVREYIVGPGEKYANNLRSDFKTQAMTAGIALGGAAGAFIGYESAVIEANNTQTSVQTWQEPVTHRKYLGDIPRDYHSWSSWDHRSYSFDADGRLSGGRAIYREAPVYNPDNTVKMQEVTETVSSRRFNIFGGVFGGLLLGVAGGTLAGIALSLIHKAIKGLSPYPAPVKIQPADQAVGFFFVN